MNPHILASVRLTLNALTDAELAVFGACLGWPDYAAVCRTKPWWDKVEPLFTREDATQLHHDTRTAVEAVIAQRLS